MSEAPAFLLYTDGSCWTGDRIGGWAWLAIDEFGEERCGYGSAEDTTISRMELTAAIMGLVHIGARFGPSCIELYSDSEYVVRGITERSRKRNLNQDLWDLLDQCTDAHKAVTYQHVRGHSGEYGNEEVDKLAGFARKARQDEVRV